MRRAMRAVLALTSATILASVALPALAEQPGDAWITTKVKIALLTAENVDALDVDVDTFDGRVTLHGKVATEAAKQSAEAAAREIRGVGDVRNLLAVVPEPAREAVTVTDQAIEQRVSAALAGDPSLEGSDIDVKSVNDGVVVLSGDAATLTAHRRALEDARDVDGVRRVASEIRSPDELADEEIWQSAEAGQMTEDAGRAISEAWITTKAKLALMAEPGLSPAAINVDTRRGVVTLFGSVASADVKQRAGTAVAELDGVRAVENELQVVPDVAAERTEARDEDLLAAVEQRLEGRDALADADIDVEVSNRVVRLTGTVASQADRMTALSVARATQGVDRVIDDLSLAQAGG